MGTHYDTLGVSSRVEDEELREAYRSLAKRYHPDLHAGSPEALQRSAASMMSVVNEAYAVLSDPERRRHYDHSLAARHAGRTGDGVQRRARPPGRGECDLCGHYPAVYAPVEQHIGMLVARSVRELNAELCRQCGLEIVRSMTARTLVTGWWGVISFFANFGALFENFSAWSKLRSLEQPRRRVDVDIVSPLSSPLPEGPPLWQRGGFVAFAIAMLLVSTSVVVDSMGSQSASTAPVSAGATTTAPPASALPAERAEEPLRASDLEGMCLRYTYDDRIRDVVSCTESHDARILRVVTSPAACPASAPYYFADVPIGSSLWTLCVDA